MRIALFAACALVASCIDAVPLDNAACPCLEGYYCASDQVCHPNEDAVLPMLGQKYIVDIDSNQWVAPPGFAKSLDASGDYGGVYPVFAFDILTVNPEAMTFTVLLGIIGEDGLQDRGLETYELSGTFDTVDDNGVSFTLGPEDVYSIVFGPPGPDGELYRTLATYLEFTLTGRFLRRGTEVEAGVISTVVNSNDIYGLFYLIDALSGEELCNDFEDAFGVSCDPCPPAPDDIEAPEDPLCIQFRAEALAFPNVPDLILNPVRGFDGGYL